MSLFRTAARASVATRVVGATHRRQQQKWAAQDAARAAATPAPPAQPAPAAPAPTPAPAPLPSQGDPAVLIEQLTKLGQLRDAGVLTEAEFEAQKQRILGAS